MYRTYLTFKRGGGAVYPYFFHWYQVDQGSSLHMYYNQVQKLFNYH